jgi:hypothetical protein
LEDRKKMSAESPFLQASDVQFAWDSTSLGYLKECPRKYQLTMLQGWRSRSESVHLTFGINYHKALENYDVFRANGLDHDEALLWVVHFLFCATHGWESDHSAKNRETLFRSVIWYLEQFADDPAKTLILSNGKAAVELSFRFATDFEVISGIPYILSGHMDRLVDFGGNNFVMDRKTTGSTLSGYYFEQYNPDNQMSLYTTASKVVYGMPVSGVIIDAAQIAVGFTRFERGITLRSAGQLDEWMQDFRLWMETAKRYADRGHWPMNEKACGNYGGCVFRGICGKDPSVRELYLKTDFEKKFWNPLAVR